VTECLEHLLSVASSHSAWMHAWMACFWTGYNTTDLVVKCIQPGCCCCANYWYTYVCTLSASAHLWPCFTIQLREMLVLCQRHGSATLLYMSVYREPFKIARRLGYAA
jgi:hypothetical protein